MFHANAFVKNSILTTMTRRPYDMGKRAEAVRRTRRRILDAAMEVHDEQGIAAGRWPDIAERAGVSLATIYRHFPTLEELATACGELTMQLVDPPAPERAAAVFAGAATPSERIERLVGEVYGFYERAGRIVDNVRRDRRDLPVLEQAHEQLEAGIGALVDEALEPLAAGDRERLVVRALLDVRAWEAMRERGLDGGAAREATCRLVRGIVAVDAADAATG